jgi:hypothetical protein
MKHAFITSREMFAPGRTFYMFFQSTLGAHLFRLTGYKWMGGYIGIINSEISGYYKTLPIVETEVSFLPISYGPEKWLVENQPHLKGVVKLINYFTKFSRA